MPKKRSAGLKRLEGASSSTTSGPSSTGHRSDSTHSQPVTVNERLEELRNIRTADSEQKKRVLAESVNRPSFPPQLRGLLGVPETAPPRPKFGRTLRERMRTPGPAAPKSWLGFTNSWEPTPIAQRRKQRNTAFMHEQRMRPERLERFRIMTGLKTEDDRVTFTKMILKSLAEQWTMVEEEDYPHLAIIPLRIRMQLLVYMGYHGNTINIATLHALTQGKEDITWLDLSALAGHGPLSLRKLSRFFEAHKNLVRGNFSENLDESWDADDAALGQPLISSPFSNLTHLSLSHPPRSASWRDLLDIAKQVPRLTHLSLAHWPWPTLTPNLAALTSTSSSSPETRAHAHQWNNFYAGSDGLTEPAALLRQLSSSLLCLQWLDLEGCADWMPALSILASSDPPLPTVPRTPSLTDPPRNPANGDDWIANSRPSVITIFTDTWKSLTYINCFQGWLPTAPGIQSLGVSGDPELKRNLLKHLQTVGDPSSAASMAREDDKNRASIWMDSELRLRAASRRINDIRRARGCKPVLFDYGFMQSTMKGLT